ncbi:hypothetical protein MVEN_01647200 [Mycena venus]|uniref:Uncharacterized protein n=1 Tax=Mycena venus TaxID=2733690 RepID=A0A8H6XR71_9AGAR|nr:hypothetical protein MVEN_01647200 [Mycena venus]
MVQISRALAFFALVSTGLALALNSDAATGVKGVSAGNIETAVHHGDIEEVKMKNHDTSVNSEVSGSNANSGAATAFAEDMATVNATSAGVVEPAGAEAIQPNSYVYIQNNQGYYLSRMGPTGVGFTKPSPDQYCRFKADRVGDIYIALRADNNLAITLDHGSKLPVLWLNALYPVGWFEAVSTGHGTVYLVVHNPSMPDNGPWTVTGTNYNYDAINTIRYPTGFNGLYITRA